MVANGRTVQNISLAHLGHTGYSCPKSLIYKIAVTLFFTPEEHTSAAWCVATRPQGWRSPFGFPLLAAWDPPGVEGRCHAVWLCVLNILTYTSCWAQWDTEARSFQQQNIFCFSYFTYLDIEWKVGFLIIESNFYQNPHIWVNDQPIKSPMRFKPRISLVLNYMEMETCMS